MHTEQAEARVLCPRCTFTEGVPGAHCKWCDAVYEAVPRGVSDDVHALAVGSKVGGLHVTWTKTTLGTICEHGFGSLAGMCSKPGPWLRMPVGDARVNRPTYVCDKHLNEHVDDA